MKINKKETNVERPPCTVTLLNEPNFELMAKAFTNLYYQTRKIKKKTKPDKDREIINVDEK
ncbi:hypothetical protein NDK43_04025 [Neobacillus pocheonensis]|uniref:Uncharacterized protein n=1 Tax=Neobacillus pocheonensis TaxID=363869 RepID=A0ABT0W6R2_9BACI|nr:hypothetical protein [Neobacillus pocheonensis]